MIETLLSGSIKDCSDIELPSLLGPGPTELIGCAKEDLGPGTNKGFFGEVSVDELINGTDLASMIGLTAGTVQNTTEPWLKFLLDGKIYFVAKKTYRYGLSWSHIHTANAVYGNRIIQIGDYHYRIGLLKGADTDPATFNAGYNPPGTLESEWNRLLYNVSKDLSNRPKVGQIGDNWAEYDQTDITGGLGVSIVNGRASWCQETMSHNAGYPVSRGHFSVTYSDFNSSSNTNTGYGWRPRLELVQPELNKPEELNGFSWSMSNSLVTNPVDLLAFYQPD